MSTFKIKSEIYSELDLESLKTDNGSKCSIVLSVKIN